MLSAEPISGRFDRDSGGSDLAGSQTFAERRLAGRKVLVVEDEFFVAEDLSELLRSAGAEIVGPVSTLPAALQLVERSIAPDAAILDINLAGEPVYALAEELERRGVPMMFLTGYAAENIPDRFSAIHCCEKPQKNVEIVNNLCRILG
jgi:CheY-like chemotaxis protein